MQFYLHPKVSEFISKATLITGAARSGTSIMGRLFHSLDNVEYATEPPLLFAHIPLIDVLPRDVWKFLYEAYLFEDWHFEAVAGRRLNFNENDQSCIFKAKARAVIEERLSKSHRRVENFERAILSIFVCKMPDILPFIPKLKKYYPDMTVITMFRKVESVIASLIKKNWFSEEGLTGFTAYWPIKDAAAPVVPYWIPDKDIKWWKEMNEVERSCYYYILMYDNLTEDDMSIIINYDEFVKTPNEIFRALIERLGFSEGELTRYILSKIEEQPKDRNVDFSGVDKALYEKVFETEKKCLARIN